MIDDATSRLPSLERGSVHVFWFATDVPASRLDPLESLLNDAEHARADRFHFQRDRRRFIAARGQLRILLAHHAECSPARIEFDTGPYGKPELRYPRWTIPLRFSLSRSDGIGVVAIGLEDELGLDVERVRPFEDDLAIAERMFADEEHRALRALPERARSGAFFRYWTRKEAVVKSVGRGLSCPLDRFALSPERRDAERIDLRHSGISAMVWVQSLPPLHDGYVAALASTGSPPALRCWDWPLE